MKTDCSKMPNLSQNNFYAELTHSRYKMSYWFQLSFVKSLSMLNRKRNRFEAEVFLATKENSNSKESHENTKK